MLPPLRMSGMTALCNSTQYIFYNLAGGLTHSRVANLLPTDQTTIKSLPHCLPDEGPFHCTGLDQVKDRPQGSSKLEALSVLYVALGKIGVVQDQDSGNIAVTPEIRRNHHVQFGRIQIRQFIKAEGCVVAVNTLCLLVPVSRPKCPENQIGAIGHRKQSESVNPAVLTNPVSNLNVVGMSILRESSGLGLLRGEETLLLFSNLKKPPRCFPVRLGHNTILQLF